MNLEEIVERFKIISGILEDDTAKLVPICEDAMNEILLSLKKGVDHTAPENSRRLNVAAAVLSFYKYSLCRASVDSAAAFTAGEFRIKTDLQANIKSAYRMWREARKSISDLLEDDEFVFERI